MGLIDFSLDNIGDLIKDIREAITGEAIKDPNKLAEIELKLRELEQAVAMGQIEINKAEASNPNLFTSGWRPAIGWIGALALGYHFILYPIALFVSELYGVSGIELPTVDFGTLFNLILAMLGFGGLRTYEKIKNVHNRH